MEFPNQGREPCVARYSAYLLIYYRLSQNRLILQRIVLDGQRGLPAFLADSIALTLQDKESTSMRVDSLDSMQPAQLRVSGRRERLHPHNSPTAPRRHAWLIPTLSLI